MIAEAMVRGYQGKDMKRNDEIMACVKHFALYGACLLYTSPIGYTKMRFSYLADLQQYKVNNIKTHTYLSLIHIYGGTCYITMSLQGINLCL